MSETYAAAQAIAAEYMTEIRAIGAYDAERAWAVARSYVRRLRESDADLVLAMARTLRVDQGQRGFACDLIAAHPGAMACMDAQALGEIGAGIDSWWTVDRFACTLTGPAWLRGQIGDEVILGWVRSPDRWWRRAALVSTVALNIRSKGSRGDVPRTLAVCRLLAGDHDNMVAKALSWALRELDVHDPAAVWAFLAEHDAELPSLVKREVRNKLTTGKKNSRKGAP